MLSVVPMLNHFRAVIHQVLLTCRTTELSLTAALADTRMWNVPKRTCTPKVIFPQQRVQSCKDFPRICVANDGKTAESMDDLADTSRVEPLVVAAC